MYVALQYGYEEILAASSNRNQSVTGKARSATGLGWHWVAERYATRWGEESYPAAMAWLIAPLADLPGR